MYCHAAKDSPKNIDEHIIPDTGTNKVNGAMIVAGYLESSQHQAVNAKSVDAYTIYAIDNTDNQEICVKLYVIWLTPSKNKENIKNGGHAIKLLQIINDGILILPIFLEAKFPILHEQAAAIVKIKPINVILLFK